MAKSFLEYVAEDLLAKHGNDLSRFTVVFPNKRASLFLNKYLSRLAENPLWSPRYLTISDLFREESDKVVADQIKQVCELHKSFTQITGIDETLDHFFGWGQVMLSDFDDIDKNMADASKVLGNLRDLHGLDGTDYLSEEQKAAIRKFFSTFSDDHTSLLKERFQKLWSHLNDIYTDFNKRLCEQGLAYEGGLYREVVSKPIQLLDDTVYIFIGFNLLQRVEHTLFSMLKKEGRARFYWDFDRYYLGNSEAGHYIEQNLSCFPNELNTDDDAIYSCFSTPKAISFVMAPTDNVQARYICSWLKENQRLPEPASPSSERHLSSDGTNTAIVLCDEKLLPMVIHSLPNEVQKVNITSGYPMSQSPVTSLINHLVNLRSLGYDPNRQRYRLHFVNTVLRHPYICFLSEKIPQLQDEINKQKIYYPSREQLAIDDGTSLLFKDLAGDNNSLLEWICEILQTVARNATFKSVSTILMRESFFKGFTLLNRLLELVNSGVLTVDVITLQRLIGQLVQTASIPFHGEPAEGLQVMGMLETRNLDFDHLILLSCNDGVIPRNLSDTSFIPYSIRKAYGLTTIDNKVSLFSYYFHRLLQRASDITFVYNNSTTDGHTGEMSRFMLQLMVEDEHHKIAFKALKAGQTFQPFLPQTVEKTPEVMERLITRFTPRPASNQQPQSPLLTPTAINRYMRCPLMFYYTYVNDLREPDLNDEDIIDNRIFGNIFHEASRIVYSRMMGKSRQIAASDIEEFLKNRVDIERAVDEAIRTEFFKFHDANASFRPELNGLQIINREVIIEYLRLLLEKDKEQAPFTIIGLETDVTATIETEQITTTIGGRIDRLDRVMNNGNECIRVIDYKTGSFKPHPLPDVEAIFQQESLQNHSDYYLQTMLYACIVSSQQSVCSDGHHIPVVPALLFIQHNTGDNSNPVLKFGKDYIDDINSHKPLFTALLKAVVSEMFCKEKPFVPTTDLERCTKCPYKTLCSIRPADTSKP